MTQSKAERRLIERCRAAGRALDALEAAHREWDGDLELRSLSLLGAHGRWQVTKEPVPGDRADG